MASESAFDRAQMAVAANQAQDAVDQLNGQITTLQSQQEQLMAGWQGSAATAFNSAFGVFEADLKKVIVALQGMQESLVGNRANYEATETANTAAASRIHSALSGS